MTRPGSGALSAALAACSGVLLAAGVPQTGRAGTLELKVAPLISRTPSGPCPTTITLIETLQPYREGSYGVNGRAALSSVATGWRLVGRDGFSATWVGQLGAPYQRCTAAAGILRADTTPYRDHSYLRMRFSGGRAQLILDMTGMRDPNGYTPVILNAGVSQGQPVWSWGGSD
jgi:hypothetical protein